MSAEEAKAFGIVDEVTTKRAVELEEAKASAVTSVAATWPDSVRYA